METYPTFTLRIGCSFDFRSSHWLYEVQLAFFSDYPYDEQSCAGEWIEYTINLQITNLARLYTTNVMSEGFPWIVSKKLCFSWIGHVSEGLFFFLNIPKLLQLGAVPYAGLGQPIIKGFFSVDNLQYILPTFPFISAMSKTGNWLLFRRTSAITKASEDIRMNGQTALTRPRAHGECGIIKIIM